MTLCVKNWEEKQVESLNHYVSNSRARAISWKVLLFPVAGSTVIYIIIYSIYIYQQKQEEVAVHLHSLQDLLQIFPRNLDRKATCSWLSRISFCEEEVVGLAPWVLMDAPLQYRARALAKHVPRFDSKQHLPLFDQGAGASSGSRFRALRLEKGSN